MRSIARILRRGRFRHVDDDSERICDIAVRISVL
jgi:hypothetical protein